MYRWWGDIISFHLFCGEGTERETVVKGRDAGVGNLYLTVVSPSLAPFPFIRLSANNGLDHQFSHSCPFDIQWQTLVKVHNAVDCTYYLQELTREWIKPNRTADGSLSTYTRNTLLCLSCYPLFALERLTIGHNISFKYRNKWIFCSFIYG